MAAVIGVGEEGVLLGVAQERPGAAGEQLDRDQGRPAAQAVHGNGVAENEALARDDVAEGRAVLQAFLLAGRREDTAGELVAAHAEVQLVAGALRRARDAEPAPALGGVGVRGVHPRGRRGQLTLDREGAMDDRPADRSDGSDICRRLGRGIGMHRSSMPAGPDLVETKSVTDDAEYWDSQAATFDEQPDHGLRDPQVREAWRRLLLAHLPPAPAAVADIGCGTGSLSVLLAAAGYTVTGLDSAPAMIRAARAKAAAARVSARFVTSDAASPALPAGSFNVVLSRHVLWAMPNVDEALAAWVRLLQPGGTLLLVEGRWHTGAGMAASWVQEAVLRLRRSASVTPLDDPVLWGGPVTDERYLLVSHD